jgi:hypothetical protein
MKFSRLNHFVNKVLFGRKPEDVFDTFYKANNVEDLQKLCEGEFEIVLLNYNYDPGYTSFNNLTFAVSNVFHKLISGLGFNFTYPHIVGILKKV